VWEWRARRAACPLLVHGTCSVYQMRPVACRLHLAVGHPDHCHDEEKRQEQQYVSPGGKTDMGTVMSSLLQEAGYTDFQFGNLGEWLEELLRGVE
jgi:Fe-S-cluster containining protein